MGKTTAAPQSVVATRVKLARINQHKTIRQCADESGLSAHEWRELEDGVCHGAIELAKAARALETSVEWFVFGDKIGP